MSKKKDAALHGLTKKERAALEARAAELAAEIARREAKAKRKAKAAKVKPPKKVKGAKPEPVEPVEIIAEPEAPIVVEDVVERAKPLDADAMRDTLDAEIKARLAAKRAERPAKTMTPEDAASNPDPRAEDAAVAHVAEIVETEDGREIAVGPAAADVDFAKPSEAPKRFEDNVNGNGQYKIKTVGDVRKERGYTRVTTYIDCLEDKTQLEKWRSRVLLEGMSEADVTRVDEIVTARDETIAKARKADRKGKLAVGELAVIVDRAWGDFKRGLNALADDVFEIGGGREKATKGTDIHALCDLAERDGIAAVGDKLTAGEITPADLADVEAYLDAIRRLGARPVMAEQVIVNDELGVAGRLDRVYMVKLPGEARARKRVVDLKTGSVEYGKGKIAQQIEMYAGGHAYDEETGERTPLGVDRTLGLLIHLPAGSGRATVHRVDLSLGRKGNRLAADVRAWRNEGKRAIDLKVDVLAEIEKATDVGPLN